LSPQILELRLCHSQTLENNGIVWSQTPKGEAVIIAHRRLIVSSPSGNKEVPIRLFQPEENDGTWVCRYEIDWPNRKWSSFAGGIDSIQALILALQKIGIEIYTSSYHLSQSVKWIEQKKGYGFPVTSNVRDLLVGDDVNL
jgi:hypothetical protein